MTIGSTSFYDALFNAQLDIVIICDDKGIIKKASPSIKKLFQRNEISILNQSISLLLPKLNFSKLLEEIGSNAYIFKTSIEALHLSGNQFYIDININSFITDNETFYSFSIKDSTDEQAYRNELKNRYWNIIENSSDYITKYNRSGIHTYMNPAALKVTGLKKEAIIGKSHIELGFDPKLSHYWEENINHVFNTGETLQLQFDWESPEGTRYVDWRLSPERDQDGEIFSVIGISRDITSQKAIEIAHRENQSRLDILTRYTPTYLIELDTSGHIVYINRTYEGMTINDALGTNILNWLPPPSQVKVQQTLKDLPTFKNTLTLEYEVPDLTGKVISYVAQFTPVLTKTGEIQKIILTATDITNLINTKKALKESDTKYKAFFEQAAIGVSEIISKTGDFIRINNRYCEIVGYSPEEMKTINFQKITHPEDLQNDLDHMKLLLEGKIREYSIDKRYIRKDKSIVWVNLTISPLWQIGEEPYSHIAVVEDITERKQTEAENQSYTEELERKNEELEQFAYIASHDLQEPLRTVISLTDILSHEYKEAIGTDGNTYINYIKLSTSRMSALIKDLLEYSQIGKTKTLSSVNCNELIRNIKKDLALTIKETNTEITVSPLPTITAYESELISLFQNLISNAIKFRKPDTHCQINISSSTNEQEVTFSIKDNGIGIEKEYHTKIFEIFQRLHTRKEYEGTGIGLAHCRKIVELHKGTIDIESTINKGTTFNIKLPLHIQ